LKSPKKNIGIRSLRNQKGANNHLSKLTAVVMEITLFLENAIRDKGYTYELSFQTTTPRQSHSLVLAGNNRKCMKLEIFAASKNILICLIMNGKNSQTNVWKRMKMAKRES